MALVLSATNVQTEAPVHFAIDNLSIEDTASKGLDRARLANNGDLCVILLISYQNIVFKAFRMSSHTDRAPKSSKKLSPNPCCEYA